MAPRNDFYLLWLHFSFVRIFLFSLYLYWRVRSILRHDQLPPLSSGTLLGVASSHGKLPTASNVFYFRPLWSVTQAWQTSTIVFLSSLRCSRQTRQTTLIELPKQFDSHGSSSKLQLSLPPLLMNSVSHLIQVPMFSKELLKHIFIILEQPSSDPSILKLFSKSTKQMIFCYDFLFLKILKTKNNLWGEQNALSF